MKVAVIGGGAAGFFSAIHAKTNYPNAEVTLLEKTQKILAKVKISGGGRCNVTTGLEDNLEISKCYPRGEKFMKRALYTFDAKDTQNWFETRGVKLKTEKDGRVFPVSNNSQSVIDCLLTEIKKLNIKMELSMPVIGIGPDDHGIILRFKNSEARNYDKVIVATGGSPKRANLNWLEELGHKIEEPYPSLFTLNMPNEKIIKLMGVSVPNAQATLQGTKLKSQGPLLITHWGMSGPAVLKLSAFGAKTLALDKYQGILQVNWIDKKVHEALFDELSSLFHTNSKKPIGSLKAFGLAGRLWIYLLSKIGISEEQRCGELGKKSINKLVNVLIADQYKIEGKTTFKEEFVTCGGISLKSIKPQTMESKAMENLYFCGEILDIDGITGGFNFQAAWTTAFIAGQLN